MKIVIIITISITLLASIVNSQKTCNGYAELCDKLYSNIAYATTHNSYAFGENVAANQNYDIPTQLKDGIRGFMLDALYPKNSTTEIHLCHGSCDLLDVGKATDVLSGFVTWLGNNPNEVITILWENTGKVPATAAAFDQIYTQTGLSKFAYFQSADAEWPTLGKMIDSGKRVVNFIGNGADPKTVPWLMPEFDYVFETPFQNTDINSFQCTIDRPKNQPRPMYVLNHFVYTNLGPPFPEDVDIPQPEKANVTNAASLATHSQQCKQTFNKIPNFLAVDFYDQGDDTQNVFSVTADLNGVQYTPKQLGDGKAPNVQGKKGGGTNAAQPSNDLRNANVLVGLAGVGTLAMFVL